MFIVIRKQSIKKMLALSIFMIFAGISLLNPLQIFAKDNDYLYIYPLPNNNPVQSYGLFVSDNIEYGVHPLNVWEESFKGKTIVVGVPEQMDISKEILFGKGISDRIVASVNKKVKDIKNPPKGGRKDSDTVTIKRQVGSITEEIRVDIGKHLKDNTMLEGIIDSLNKGLLPKDMLEKELDNKQKQIEKELDKGQKQTEKIGEIPDGAEFQTLLGSGLLASGAYLLFKVLVFAL